MKANVRIRMISESDRCKLHMGLGLAVPRQRGAMVSRLSDENDFR